MFVIFPTQNDYLGKLLRVQALTVCIGGEKTEFITWTQLKDAMKTIPTKYHGDIETFRFDMLPDLAAIEWQVTRAKVPSDLDMRGFDFFVCSVDTCRARVRGVHGHFRAPSTFMSPPMFDFLHAFDYVREEFKHNQVPAMIGVALIKKALAAPLIRK